VEAPGERGAVKLHVRVPWDMVINKQDVHTIKSELIRDEFGTIGQIRSRDVAGTVDERRNIDIIIFCIDSKNRSLTNCIHWLDNKFELGLKGYKVKQSILPRLRDCERLYQTRDSQKICDEVILVRKPNNRYVYVIGFGSVSEEPVSSADREIIRRIMQSFWID
jgi:hypothetical protein